jgi:outer membrane murein-binding lipoprotein Lpp
MPYCWNCGTYVREEYCGKCGKNVNTPQRHALEKQETSITSNPVFEQTSGTERQKNEPPNTNKSRQARDMPPKNGSSTFLGVISVILAVALIAAGILYGMEADKLSLANKNITRLNSDVTTLELQLNTEKNNVSALQAQLATANENVTSLTSELSVANGKIDNLTTELVAANADISTLTNDLALLTPSNHINQDLATAIIKLPPY